MRFLQTNKRFITNNNFSFLFGKKFKAMRRREILTNKQTSSTSGLASDDFSFLFGKELKANK